MFFSLSKIVWSIANPGNLLLILLVLGMLGLMVRSWRFGRRFIGLAVFAALTVTIVPVGNYLIYPLENRFPTQTNLQAPIEGIVVLGGFSNQFVTKARGQVALNGAVERLISLAVLAQRYPDAKLVLSGGSGNLFRQNLKEVNALKPILKILGLQSDQIHFESNSRNTHENALFTYKQLKPKPNQRWVLITSASHMPRAVGSFRKVGWNIIPYPVDYNLEGERDLELGFNFISGLGSLNKGMYEWIGLFVYRLTGKTDSFFPSPGNRK